MTHFARPTTASYLKKAGALCLAFSLASCATVPSSGPAAPQIAPVKPPATTTQATTPVTAPETAPQTEAAPETVPDTRANNSVKAPPLNISSIRLGVTLPSFAPPVVAVPERSVPSLDASRTYPCRSSILTDMDGTVLLENNASSQRYPASVTKVMTMILVFDAIQRGELKLTDKITFSAHAASRERTNLALSKGAQVTVENGLRALAVHSANDMATAFGEHLGGSEARFAQMMTAKARQIGMTSTVFKNASGLPNTEMVTTARDMALMGRYLVKNYPNQYHFFGDTSFTFRGTTYRNHNPSLRNYPGVDGIKTGFTRASLFNIVVSAKRPEGRLVVALFGCPTTPVRTREVEALLDHGFGVLRARAAQPAPAAVAPAQIPVQIPAPVPAPLSIPAPVRQDIPQGPVPAGL